MGGSSAASTSDDDDDDLEEENDPNNSSSLQLRKRTGSAVKGSDNEMILRGAPWFEDLVENSRLGTLRRRKGGHTSKDGSVTIEWEVAEWESGGINDDDDDDETVSGVQGTGKRKFKGDGDADVSMRTV